MIQTRRRICGNFAKNFPFAVRTYIINGYLFCLYRSFAVCRSISSVTARSAADFMFSVRMIDKPSMAAKIFADPALLEKVNQIIHPAVKKYLADRLAEARAKGDVELFFVEAALLIENGFGEVVDEMWYIYAREEVRRKRLSVSRGYTPEKIDRIMSSQLSENEFRKHCDFVIDNSDSLENSYRQIRQKLEAYTWRE